MIEIPIKKRHSEMQKLYENVYIKEYRDRVLVELLAVIADRLTDIADELGTQTDTEEVIKCSIVLDDVFRSDNNE